MCTNEKETNVTGLLTNRVIRPNTNEPDVYQMTMDESTLSDIEVGITLQILQYEQSVALMKQKELRKDLYPNGSRYTAEEDLMFLYNRLSMLNNLLFEIRFLMDEANRTATEA